MTNLENITDEMYTDQPSQDFGKVTGFDNTAYSIYNAAQLNKARILLDKGVREGNPDLIKEARKLIAEALHADSNEKVRIDRLSPEALIEKITSDEGKANGVRELAYELLENHGYNDKVLTEYGSIVKDDVEKVNEKLAEKRADVEKQLKMSGLGGKSLEDKLKEYDKESDSRKATERGKVFAQYLTNIPIDPNLQDPKYDKMKKYHEGLQLVAQLLLNYSDENGKIRLTEESLALYKEIVKRETGKETSVEEAILDAKLGGLDNRIIDMHQRVLAKKLYESANGKVDTLSGYIKANIHNGVEQYGSLVSTVYDRKQKEAKEKQKLRLAS